MDGLSPLGDLVDLVDVDDAPACRLDVVVGVLQKLDQDVFHVLAHVAGLGQGGGVGYGEGDVQDPGQGLGQQGFARTGGTDQEDVALVDLHVVGTGAPGVIDALIMVVHGHGQDLLGLVLADDVFIEQAFDLGRRQKLAALGLLAHRFLSDDLIAERDALVANIDVGTGDEPLHLVLILAAKGAAQFTRHGILLPCHTGKPTLPGAPGVLAGAAMAPYSCSGSFFARGSLEVNTLSMRP